MAARCTQRPSFAHRRDACSNAVSSHQSGQVISINAASVRVLLTPGDDSFTVLVPPLHVCRGLGRCYRTGRGRLDGLKYSSDIAESSRPTPFDPSALWTTARRPQESAWSL